MKRGKSERYLKDDAELETYLIEGAVEDLRFKLFNGQITTGKDFQRILQLSKLVKHNMDPIVERIGNQHVVEQTAACNGFSPNNRTQQVAEVIAQRLDAISPSYEKGWKGGVKDGGFVFARTIRGVETRIELGVDFLNGNEGQRLAKAHEVFTEFFGGVGTLMLPEGKELQINGPYDLFKKVIEGAKKGLTTQRYKGLGEMNAEQLWETTLDPNTRSLLQVKVENADMASDIFSTLMGDIVEPRRDFIQEHALEVSNLDV